jgi:hypothetical protein
MMSLDQPRADPASTALDVALERMMAARSWVSRWFSPEAVACVDPDAPEVIGSPRGVPLRPETRAGAA